MNILLINPLCRLPYLLPLGLGYIAGVMRQEGHNVRILDINGNQYSQGEVEKILAELDYDIVGIGGLSSTYKYVKWLAGVIKEHKPLIKVIAGNLVSTAHPVLLLKNSMVDIAVIDEGELTFADLVRAIEKGKDLKDVKGIIYKDGEKIIENPPRERIRDLDSLPFPAWDLFPMEVYLNHSTLSEVSFGLRGINVSSTRGCPYECTFCSHPFGRVVYSRSAQNLILEIKELKKRYRVGFINSSDDLFIMNQPFVMEFCERLIAERMDIKWSVPGRVNLVNETLLKKMRQAGCVEIGYGFESGSQVVLDKMKKRVEVQQAKEAIKMTRKAGINIIGSFIIGMPGETEETIRETLDFIKSTQLPIYRFFFSTPYPKTELYKIAKTMGRLPADEDKYMESLGEMRSTCLVNLTDFSDNELVRLKNWAEDQAKKDMSFGLKAKEFTETWRRRYIIAREGFRLNGIAPTVKMFYLNVLRKLRRKAI